LESPHRLRDRVAAHKTAKSLDIILAAIIGRMICGFVRKAIAKSQAACLSPGAIAVREPIRKGGLPMKNPGCFYFANPPRHR
jgi:hypothetical protein